MALIIKKTSPISTGMLHLGLCCTPLLVKNDQFFLIHINNPHSHMNRKFYISCLFFCCPFRNVRDINFCLYFNKNSLLAYILSASSFTQKKRNMFTYIPGHGFGMKKKIKLLFYRHFILIGFRNTDFRGLHFRHFFWSKYLFKTLWTSRVPE